MLLSINQPAYLPWLGYFDRIAKSDLHVVLDHVQFEKNSFTNRNKILLNGRPLYLTIPVLTKGKFGDLNINSLAIDMKSNWQRKHWQSIQQAYLKSPYWNDLQEHLECFYQLGSEKIIDWLNLSRDFFLQYLEIKTPIKISSHFDFFKTKSDLVLEICQHFGATKYLSGPLGRNYLEEEIFKENNIEIIYHDYAHPQYPQSTPDFLPYMSILDLIANCGKNSLEVLTNV